MSEGSAPAGRVVLLSGPGTNSHIVYHYLKSRVRDMVVVMEQPVDRWTLTRRRARRLGWATVAGQLAFIAAVVPVLKYRARGRVRVIMADAGFDPSPIPGATMVDSVNADETVELLRSLAPDLVVVNGTRIISSKVLDSVSCPFVNLHMGITPRYRGVHGGYWALAESRPDLVGTTVHLVDSGIDTGTVLAQSFFAPTDRDSFVTYPLLHLVHGLPLLAAQIDALLAGRVEPYPVARDTDGPPSQLRWHPTVWGYLWRRILHGVR